MRTTNHGAAQPLRKHRRAIGIPLALLAVGVVACLATVLLTGGSTDAWRTTDGSVTAASASGSPTAAPDADDRFGAATGRESAAIAPRYPNTVANKQATYAFQHPSRTESAGPPGP